MDHQEHPLWLQLKNQNIVNSEYPNDDDLAPWYIKAMQGFAGWFAALFMLGFVAALFEWIFRYDNEVLLFIVGLLCCGAAYLIFRSQRHAPFLEQLALATSLCGQFMVGWALFDIFSIRETSAFLALAAFQCILAIVMPNFLHRVISTWFAMIALFWGLNLNGIFGLDSAFSAGLFTLIWLKERKWYRYHSVITPIGFGLAISLVQLSGHAVFQGEFVRYFSHASTGFLQVYSPYIGSTVLAMSCVFLVRQILIEQKIPLRSKSGALALLGMLLLLVISFPIAGVSSALLILLIGFFRQRLTLVALGIIALISFVSWYYYNLSETLLIKSFYLFGTGSLLLIVLWAISHITKKPVQADTIKSRMTKRKWLSVACAILILACINFNIYKKESLIAHGDRVLLELAPVDPRSLMQGDYMRLRFAIGSQALNSGTESNTEDGYILVKLDENGVAQFDGVTPEPIASSEQKLLRYRIRNGRLKFATNAFFFEEGTAEVYEQAKYGEFKVDENGNMLLTRMLDNNFHLLGINKP